MDRRKGRKRVRAAAVNSSAVAHDSTVNFLAEPGRLLLAAGPKQHPEATVTNIRSEGPTTCPAALAELEESPAVIPLVMSQQSWNDTSVTNSINKIRQCPGHFKIVQDYETNHLCKTNTHTQNHSY